MTAAELIAHLESGGSIATGEPEHVLFLRYEIWNYSGSMQKHLGAYGWGSALGAVEWQLKCVLDEPHKWVKVAQVEHPKDREAQEEEARAKLAELGRYVDYEWEWTAVDTRELNTIVQPEDCY